MITNIIGIRAEINTKTDTWRVQRGTMTPPGQGRGTWTGRGGRGRRWRRGRLSGGPHSAGRRRWRLPSVGVTGPAGRSWAGAAAPSGPTVSAGRGEEAGWVGGCRGRAGGGRERVVSDLSAGVTWPSGRPSPPGRTWGRCRLPPASPWTWRPEVGGQGAGEASAGAGLAPLLVSSVDTPAWTPSSPAQTRTVWRSPGSL